MEKTSYTPGTFSWIDLSTTDTTDAKKFFGELLGWTTRDIEHDGRVVYIMCELRGKKLAGMGEMQPEQTQAGIPPHWTSYVSVASAVETAKKVEAAGGKVLMPPMDIFDDGAMAIFADPHGATFGVWQPKAHTGAELLNEVGAMCWNELYSPDAAASKKFYGEVFGWTMTETQMADGAYNSIKVGEAVVGGMIEMKGDQWKGVPPHWGVYFAVDDCDASAAQVKNMGGTVVHGPAEVPEVGRFAVCCDAQGAHFSIIKLAAALAK